METKMETSPAIILIIKKCDPLAIIPSVNSDKDWPWCQAIVEEIAPAIQLIGLILKYREKRDDADPHADQENRAA